MRVEARSLRIGSETRTGLGVGARLALDVGGAETVVWLDPLVRRGEGLLFPVAVGARFETPIRAGATAIARIVSGPVTTLEVGARADIDGWHLGAALEAVNGEVRVFMGRGLLEHGASPFGWQLAVVHRSGIGIIRKGSVWG